MPQRPRKPAGKKPTDPRLQLAKLVDRLAKGRQAVLMADIVQNAARGPAASLARMPADKLAEMVEAAVDDSLLLKDLRTFFDRQTGTHDQVWVYRLNVRHPLAAEVLGG
jgi:hypothetical protein